MKYFLLLFSLLTSCTFLQAQISLTTEDMPVPGTSFRYANDTAKLSPGVTGQGNQVWDFSGLKSLRESTVYTYLPKSDSNYRVHPNANLIQYDSASKQYYLFNNSPSSYSLVATNMQIIYPFRVIYPLSPSVAYFTFPFTYKDQTVSMGSNSYELAGMKDSTVADAWGKLITPDSTFDVLRVAQQVTRIQYNDFGIAATQVNFFYHWYAKGMRTPLVSFNFSGTKPIQDNAFYITWYKFPNDVITDTEKEQTKDVIQISPNPNNGNFMLKSTLAESSTIRIHDMTGNQIYSAAITGNSEIDLAGLSAGIYMVRLEAGQQWYSKRVVISK